MSVLRNSLVIVLALCATARAGTKTTLTIDASKNDPCAQVAIGDSTNSMTVKVAPPWASAVEIRLVRLDDAGTTTLATGTVAAGSDALLAPLAYEVKGGELIVVDVDGKRLCQLQLQNAPPPAPVTNPPAPVTNPPGGDADSSSNARALAHLNQMGIIDHVRTGGPRGHHYKLYHLPDGSPAFPLPSNVAEEDEIEVWIVQLVGQQSSAEITDCKDVPAVRITGTFPAAKAIIQKPESGNPQNPPLELRRISASIKCGESVAYKVTTNGGARDVSFKIAPVYLFSWGVAYGFDFGRPTKLTLVERPMTGGTGTERVIVEDSQQSGFRPMATLTLNACRANLKDWDMCDGIGLTGLIDLTRPTSGAGLGLKLQPWPGLGFLVGMTVFQTDEIAAGHAMKPGDVFSGSGDLPVEHGFNKHSFGLFLGVGGDTDTVKSLF